jgi:hypothetical protein
LKNIRLTSCHNPTERSCLWLVFSFLLCLSIQQAVYAESGWSVLQDSLYYGDISTAVGANALRMDTKDASILIVPPYKSITLFSKEHRLYFTESIEQFQKRTSDTINDVHAKMVPGKKEMICGLQTQEYDTFDKANDGTMKVRRKFWLTKDRRVSPKLADACAMFVSVKPGYGLPVRIWSRKGGSNRPGPSVMEKALDTISFKAAEFDPEIFKIPRTFAKASSEAAVLFGQRTTAPGASDLNDLFKN